MKILKLVGIIVASLFVLSACNNKGDEDKLDQIILVSYELYTPNIEFNIASVKALLSNPTYGMGALADKMKYDVQMYKITYKTLFEGDTIFVSGVVSLPVPLNKKETFPILSYQHGTIVKKSDAPSENIDNEYMTYMASTGMVVAIADYVGFGESSSDFHPYMMNDYTVNAVLDMIRATKELVSIENPFELNGNLFMYGYSQGGSATLGALSALENNKSNYKWNVTAAVCAAGAYDLAEMRKWIMKQTNFEQPYFVAYLLESYSNYAQVSKDYSLVFNEEFASKIPAMFDGKTSSEVINAQFGTTHVGELFNDNFENDSIFNSDSVYAPLLAAFNQNKITAWPLTTSLSIHYGSDDIWVPGDQSLTLFKDFQANGSGAKVKLERFEGLNHVTAIPTSISKAMTWFLSFN